MEPTPDPGAAPTPSRNKRSWIMTAAVATGLAVGAAGTRRCRHRRELGIELDDGAVGFLRVRPGAERSAAEWSSAEWSAARRHAGPVHDAQRSR